MTSLSAGSAVRSRRSMVGSSLRRLSTKAPSGRTSIRRQSFDTRSEEAATQDDRKERAATAHEPDPANEFAATKGTKPPCGGSPHYLPARRFVLGEVGSPRRWAWCSCGRGFNRRVKVEWLHGPFKPASAGRASQCGRLGMYCQGILPLTLSRPHLFWGRIEGCPPAQPTT